MKTLPSKLFSNCIYSPDDDAGFYDIVPAGFEHAVSIYLGSDTVKSEQAVAKAGTFFDRLHEWDFFCRNAFANVPENDEDFKMITEYFSFYKDEAPDVFMGADPAVLSLAELVDRLKLVNMATHGTGEEQRFNVDFTLGYDQLLCIYFDNEANFDHMAWES